MPGLTLERLSELENLLRIGELHPLEVYAAVTSSIGAKVWRSAHWKLQRAERLGDACNVCASNEGPLTLQHLWHPRVPSEVMDQALSADWATFLESFEPDTPRPMRPEKQFRKVQRATCPKCVSVAIQERKKKRPKFICRGTLAGRACLHEWDESHQELVEQPDTEANQRNYEEYYTRLRALRSRASEAFRETPAFRVSATKGAIAILADSRRYLSLEDTVTFCRRCAFLWDKKGLRPCIECGRRLAEPESRCSECSPDHVLCEVCGARHHHRKYPTCLFCIHRQEPVPRCDPTTLNL